MPKKVITEATLPVALHLIDTWKGRLTWNAYRDKLVEALHVKGGLTTGTLKKHAEIQRSFTMRQKELREKASEDAGTEDVTLDFLKAENEALAVKVRRLEDKLNLYKEQFVRWQNNLYQMPGVDMEVLNSNIDKPLVPVDRVSK
ncbi:MAG: hypothetical protein N0E59_21260 [Candidatus Thiodiazotropha taylori]|nr:hypothetical protein [Candidatus Thiodiazotropha taylori]MCG8113288.1 hypothetical protein [Candidatus Thiodiazotropha taylori]MCW4285649.1 hypothetical protein [Candidatus Thiodiazotropha taylori]MCW4327738.1 hypothetical protein [Candidatus Thiodiazotropha taylori]